MSLADDPRPPLPSWITEAYTVLSTHIVDSQSDDAKPPAISRADAVPVLQTADELSLEPTDAEYAIKRLIERGYLYEVGDELRVTTPAADG